VIFLPQRHKGHREKNHYPIGCQSLFMTKTVNLSVGNYPLPIKK